MPSTSGAARTRARTRLAVAASLGFAVVLVAPAAGAQTDVTRAPAPTSASGEAGRVKASAESRVGEVDRPGVEHLHFRYGPLDIGPGQNLIQNSRRIPQPAVDGWVVGFRPNLEREDGTVPPVDVVHLHHGVWLDTAHRDSTSPNFPERFFASGEEKTALALPPGYGYQYAAADQWLLDYMVHDLTPKAFTLYITYDVDFIPAASAAAKQLTPVHPIWMDVQNGSIYPVFDVLKGSGTNGRFTYPDDAVDPYGDGPAKNDWTVPTDGVLVKTFGHLHPGGLRDDLSLVRDGRTAHLFASTAHYYEPAGAVSWDVSMTATRDKWRVGVHAGDVLRLTTTYDTSRASWYESMGLEVVWMADSGRGADPFTTRVDRTGRLTHGHLAENDHHGGVPTTLADPATAPAGPASTLDITDFTYGAGNLGSATPIPTVTAGQTITFDNVDAPTLDVWHSITACKAPCTASTGVAYPLADGSVPFDSGQLGVAGPPTVGRLTWTTPSDLSPGTYTFFCRIHPFMRGAFRVVAPPP